MIYFFLPLFTVNAFIDATVVLFFLSLVEVLSSLCKLGASHSKTCHFSKLCILEKKNSSLSVKIILNSAKVLLISWLNYHQTYSVFQWTVKVKREEASGQGAMFV